MRFVRMRPKWTLGRLMILIVVLDLPLALYVQHEREVAMVDLMLRDLDRKLRENPQSYACPPTALPAKLGYIEYGSDPYSKAGETPK